MGYPTLNPWEKSSSLSSSSVVEMQNKTLHCPVLDIRLILQDSQRNTFENETITGLGKCVFIYLGHKTGKFLRLTWYKEPQLATRVHNVREILSHFTPTSLINEYDKGRVSE